MEIVVKIHFGIVARVDCNLKLGEFKELRPLGISHVFMWPKNKLEFETLGIDYSKKKEIYSFTVVIIIIIAVCPFDNDCLHLGLINCLQLSLQLAFVFQELLSI